MYSGNKKNKEDLNMKAKKQTLGNTGENIIKTSYIPLYSNKRSKDKTKSIFPKSGLNQWNASGRDRNPNEIYIPLSIEWHKLNPGFFPEREEKFTLLLPDGQSIKAKVCQEGGKALMSDPNKALGEWILRSVLKLKEGEVLKYNKLEDMGIDSVRVDKIGEGEYKINFARTVEYDMYEKDVESQLMER